MRVMGTATLIILLLMLYPAALSAALSVEPMIRNDAIGTIYGDFDFNDILEGRIICTAADHDKNVRFYSDLRGFLYSGRITRIKDYYDLKLMRAFLRFFLPFGDITAGKTYINFGNPGALNLFEFDKNLNMSDTTYDREGILALEYVFYHNDSIEWKSYCGISPVSILHRGEPHISAGSSLTAHAGSFEFGPVINRLRPDRNIAGIFFKGDAVVGIQGEYALHFNDRMGHFFIEANAGIDYSFLNGRLITQLLVYFNERGAVSRGDYMISDEYYFSARSYIYVSLTGVIDEFVSIHLYSFINLIDGSSFIIPSLRWILTDGLSMTFLFPVAAGYGNQEFSYKRAGYLSIIVRVEGKF